MCFLFFRFLCLVFSFFFFFNDTATTEIYTLSYTTLFRSLVAHAGRSRACAGARARRRAWRGAGSGRVPRVVPPGRPGAVRARDGPAALLLVGGRSPGVPRRGRRRFDLRDGILGAGAELLGEPVRRRAPGGQFATRCRQLHTGARTRRAHGPRTGLSGGRRRAVPRLRDEVKPAAARGVLGYPGTRLPRLSYRPRGRDLLRALAGGDGVPRRHDVHPAAAGRGDPESAVPPLPGAPGARALHHPRQ